MQLQKLSARSLFLDTSTPAQLAGFLVAFRRGLSEEGFVEGKIAERICFAANYRERLGTAVGVRDFMIRRG